jgi:tyrosine-protein phosphatase YwqE
MARQAEADGVGAVVATPHVREDHQVALGELSARAAELSRAVAAAGCATSILPGGEVAVSMVGRLSDAELSAASLGGIGRWILLEPPAGPLDERLEGAVVELHSRDFHVLVAHPERHLAADLISRLGRVIRLGALVQATAAALVEEPSRQGMLALARAGVLHVLGSDSHSSRAGRPVALAAGLRALADVEPTRAHIGWIADVAPRGILGGRDLIPPFAPRH